ncbi:hypothetical protein PsYK624_118620 [Phanerochaete sordida]|uniref:Uncharacterized protein n=1 Tax=Phanerochaete sordida TaxID=48140 RepID=A0A9P3GIP1_9APHY|nr:hypothetical protein PsYK624_118620 [Phanerochaete sordida]
MYAIPVASCVCCVLRASGTSICQALTSLYVLPRLALHTAQGCTNSGGQLVSARRRRGVYSMSRQRVSGGRTVFRLLKRN